MTVSAIALLIASALGQKQQDPIKSLWLDLRDQHSSRITLGSVSENWDIAQKKNATVMQRFKFASMVVIAFDKGLMSNANCKRFATNANSVVKASELKLSPTYCYVVARLGLVNPGIGETQVQAARMYYEAKHDGVSANVYARILVGHPDTNIRAKALQYALEAQSKQADTVKIRWLVAGCYYFKALATKEKQYWQAAVHEYDRTLELASSGKDKEFTSEDLQLIKFYSKRAKEELARAK